MKRTAALLLTVWTCACVSSRAEQGPLTTVMQSNPSLIRIQTSTGWLTLYDPVVKEDTLFGVERVYVLEKPPNNVNRAVAVHDITAVETRHPSPSRTVALALGFVGAAIGAALGIIALTVD